MARSPQHRRKPKSGAVARRRASPKRLLWHVLIVDDRSDICDVLKMGLEMSGKFRATFAETAADAIFILDHDRLDMAIIDVLIGGMDGLRVASCALQHDVTVLLMTGAPVIGEQLQAIACPHILKPFRISELIRETEALLADTKGSQARLRAALERTDSGRNLAWA